MDLQYNDRDVGYLLGVWLVALGFLAVSTTRPDYSPVVGPIGDPAIFAGLCGLVLIGAAIARLQDLALGVPMGVCGGLVVWTVGRTLAIESPPLTGSTGILAGGLLVLGGLFVREGVVIARGWRHHGRHATRDDSSHDDGDPPPMRWGWWLGAVALLGVGTSGLL